MDHATHCDLLSAELGRLDTAVRAADLGAIVPSCPDWTVRELLQHLGSVQRWAELIVRTRAPERIPSSSIEVDPPGADAEAAAWADWLADGGTVLLATLRDADPDARAWSWGGDHRAAWWSRRQVHEVVVHRIDIELATGTAWTVAADVAVDAIDEHLANIAASAYFSPRVKLLKGDGSIHLHTTDTDGEWMIQLRNDGFTITHEHGKGTVAARGTARDLLGVVTNRGGADALEVFGEAELLDWWLTNSALE